MYHFTLMIILSEWFTSNSERAPRSAVVEIIKFLSGRGYRSLEVELSSLLKDYISFPSDQSVFPNETDRTDSVVVRRGHSEIASVYTSCLKKDDSLIFLDIEDIGGPNETEFCLEADIISPHNASVQNIREQLLEDTMKCFGLTGAKDSLVFAPQFQKPFKALRDALTISESISENLFQRMKERVDREILRELKKRGSILESDLHELPAIGTKPDRVKAILDYFSGEEYQLVERKFAIVCKKNKEIIFLLRNRQDLENAKRLVCPKCSVQIGDEMVLSYYERTDKLKELVEGSRWMPLLIRDALIRAGIAKDDIYVEVKYGEDEIDVLAFYKRRVLVIETKDRPISLNDAYKLSAKTSRLEQVSSKTRTLSLDEDEIGLEYILEPSVSLREPVSRRPIFIPIMISNYDIAKDARELLKDTKESAKFLENADERLNEFIADLIREIDGRELNKLFKKLTTFDSSDSVSRLAAAQVQVALSQWYKSVQ